MEKRNDSTPDCGYTLFGALCQKIRAAPYSAKAVNTLRLAEANSSDSFRRPKWDRPPRCRWMHTGQNLWC